MNGVIGVVSVVVILIAVMGLKLGGQVYGRRKRQAGTAGPLTKNLLTPLEHQPPNED
jgi:hypothetical protein